MTRLRAMFRLAALTTVPLLLAVACKAPPVGADERGRPDPGPVDAKVDPTVDRSPEPEPIPRPHEDPSGGYAKVGDLHYLEVLTGGAQPDEALPMLVAIHGLGDEPKQFAGLVADLPVKARVILPRAIDDYEVGWSWFPVRAADPDVDALARGITRAAKAIDAGITRLERDRPTVGKPVVTGFSQGGMLTFALAVTYPEHYQAAFAVGGWLPPPLWPREDVEAKTLPPIVALHGEADPAVKFEPTREAVEHLSSIGAEAELHPYPEVGHAIPPAMREELHALIVAELEHPTPGDSR